MSCETIRKDLKLIAYFSDWKIVNKSKQTFDIQTNDNEVSFIKPINDYSFQVCANVALSNDNITQEVNDAALKLTVERNRKVITIEDRN
ncbi:hypothetical protein K0017_05375 [Staphylococcus massiliensis]|uniref:hypothetical protein n=1 Tax=Staphylococcus massiliensis TaxID=555791 RepID=UPI001EDD9230|nr:hypothetical protein [Staphylococcus massiliensis]MCG3401750.1 hypothetical protein [Staphylococcus massiliensis]